MPDIILTFDTSTGECAVKVQGVKGPACKDVTKFLTDTLGKCKDFKRLSSWYEENLESQGQVDSDLCG